MKTHETKAKDLKIKTPQSKKLTEMDKAILKEDVQRKLERIEKELNIINQEEDEIKKGIYNRAKTIYSEILRKLS